MANTKKFQRKQVFKGANRGKLKIEWVGKPEPEIVLTKWEKFKIWFNELPIWSIK